MCAESGSLSQLVCPPNPLWPQVQVCSERPVTSLSVCTFQKVHASQRPKVQALRDCISPPWVRVSKPVGEIIIFRHFTSGSRNSQHQSVFPKNAPPLLSLPGAIVEDTPGFLPHTVVSLIFSPSPSEARLAGWSASPVTVQSCFH